MSDLNPGCQDGNPPVEPLFATARSSAMMSTEGLMPAPIRRLSITEFVRSPGPALRHVRAGEEVEITSHGKVVASIIPRSAVRTTSILDDLAAWRAQFPEIEDAPFEGLGELRDPSAPREVIW